MPQNLTSVWGSLSDNEKEIILEAYNWKYHTHIHLGTLPFTSRKSCRLAVGEWFDKHDYNNVPYSNQMVRREQAINKKLNGYLLRQNGLK